MGRRICRSAKVWLHPQQEFCHPLVTHRVSGGLRPPRLAQKPRHIGRPCLPLSSSIWSSHGFHIRGMKTGRRCAMQALLLPPHGPLVVALFQLAVVFVVYSTDWKDQKRHYPSSMQTSPLHQQLDLPHRFDDKARACDPSLLDVRGESTIRGTNLCSYVREVAGNYLRLDFRRSVLPCKYRRLLKRCCSHTVYGATPCILLRRVAREPNLGGFVSVQRLL